MGQCKSSKFSGINEIAFCQETCLDLFSFYVEWNEKNQHRSMRQVLELLSSLLAKNPDESVRISTKAIILQKLLSIVTHQAAQPFVKPAFKALECFLSKGTFSTSELINSYREHIQRKDLLAGIHETTFDSEETALDHLVSEVFDWMILADISPAAGKFLVTLFKESRMAMAELQVNQTHSTILWQKWIRQGLNRQPDVLENVKNYLLPPLFKLDRPSSMEFLKDLNTWNTLLGIGSQELDAQALLQLSALEVGKKTGLVDEPSELFSFSPIHSC